MCHSSRCPPDIQIHHYTQWVLSLLLLQVENAGLRRSVYIKTKHMLQVNDAYCLITFWNWMVIVTWLHPTSLFYRYGSGSGPIWLDDVGCFGSESCLLSCSNNGIGVHNCGHSEDVAISCSGTRLSTAGCSNPALPSTFSSVLIDIEV